MGSICYMVTSEGMCKKNFISMFLVTSATLMAQPSLADFEFEKKHNWTYQLAGREQWILYGDLLKLDGTNTNNVSDTSFQTLMGNSVLNVFGSGAQWNDGIYVNTTNSGSYPTSIVTVNLSNKAIWYGPVSAPKGEISINIDNAEWKVQGTSLTAGGSNQFKTMVGHVSSDKAQAFIIGTPALSNIPDTWKSWIGANFDSQLEAIKNGDVTQWSNLQSTLQSNAWLITLAAKRIVISSYADNVYLTNGGLINLNTDGDTAAGLIVDNFESNNGTLIVNSNYVDQNLGILSSASGNLNIIDEGNIDGRGLNNQNPLIYYYGSATPSLTINYGNKVTEKGATAYTANYYTASEATSGVAGFYYTPAGSSNTSIAIQAAAVSSLLAGQTHQKTVLNRVTQARQDELAQGAIWLKPFYQHQNVYTKGGADFELNGRGMALGADKLLTLDSGQYLVGVAISTANTHIRNAAIKGQVESHAFHLYGSYQADNGLFVDLQTQVVRSNNKLSFTPVGSEIIYQNQLSNTSFGLSSKLGFIIGRYKGFFVQPYAELSIYRQKGNTYQLANYPIINDVFKSVYAGLGSRLGYTSAQENKKAVLRPYLDVAYGRELVGNNQIKLGDEVINAATNGREIYTALGVEWSFSNKAWAYVDLSYDNNGKRGNTTTVNAGFNYNW